MSISLIPIHIGTISGRKQIVKDIEYSVSNLFAKIAPILEERRLGSKINEIKTDPLTGKPIEIHWKGRSPHWMTVSN